MGYFAANQGIAHFPCTIANAVRGRNGIFGLYQPHGHLTILIAYIFPKAIMDGFHLGLNAHITLAIALCANYADRRLVNEINISAQFPRNTNNLRVTTGMGINDNRLCLRHNLPL